MGEIHDFFFKISTWSYINACHQEIREEFLQNIKHRNQNGKEVPIQQCRSGKAVAETRAISEAKPAQRPQVLRTRRDMFLGQLASLSGKGAWCQGGAGGREKQISRYPKRATRNAAGRRMSRQLQDLGRAAKLLQAAV